MKNIHIEDGRTKLAKIWFIGSCLPFLIIAIQSILGKFGEDVQPAWSWFIPTVFPTLTLMISVIGAAALKPREERVIRKTFLNITVGISYFYLAILSMILLLEPFSPIEDPIKLFAVSNFFIAPLQGICIAALGFLFTSDTQKMSDDDNEDK